MAGKVFFSVSMSLDGFMAPEAVPVEDVFSPEGQNDPRVQRWTTKWSELQAWVFPTRFFRENLKFGEGGEEGTDNDVARATFEPDGAATRIEMRTVFPTKELRDEVVEKYHAIEGGQQTLSKLAAYVTEIVRKGAEG